MNVHGCGIGWYARERCGLVDELGLDAYNRPTVYTTVAAPSHDRNLRALSKAISSSLLFGHVRAAGPGASVHQYNCHPFSMGRYMFMHNGDITDFSKIRRGLQHLLRDDLFDHMSGTTDSELLFLLILNGLPDVHTQVDPSSLQNAVLDAFCHIIKANAGKANSLNIAFTDGETTIATRYRNSDVEEPPSLYYHVGPMPGESRYGGFSGFPNQAAVCLTILFDCSRSARLVTLTAYSRLVQIHRKRPVCCPWTTAVQTTLQYTRTRDSRD